MKSKTRNAVAPESGPPERAGGILALGILAVWATGCFLTAPRGDWLEAEGSDVRATWGKKGEARQAARKGALYHARRKIWDSIVSEKVNLARGTWVAPDTPAGNGVTTIEALVFANPVFESKLRALIGSLQPVEVVDGPDGELAVRLRLDRYQVRRLVVGTLYRMRREERL